MQWRKSDWIILFLIILAGLSIRTIHLSSNPAGLFPDEASTGYDAWCLIHYGMDQHAKQWPIFFTSFADDLSGLYRYLVVALQYIIGPSILSIRLPAAIAGTLTILGISLAVSELSGVMPGLFAGFLIAFSPWSLPYSRTGQRIVLLPLILSFWFWLWLKSQKNPSKQFLYSNWFLLAFSLYTYVPIRLILPLLLPLILVYHVKTISIKNEAFWIALIIFVLVISPMILHAFLNTEQFKLRYQQVNLFQQSESRLEAITQITQNYVSHFSPDYLFLNGDNNLRHNQRLTGVLVWGQLPFLLLGFFTLLKKRKRTDILLLYWLIVSPLPAALSNEGSPHALRSFSMLIPLEIITAIGFGQLLEISNRKFWIKILTIIFVGVIMLQSIWISYDLIYKYPVYSAAAWEFGTREAIEECLDLLDTSSVSHFWITQKAIGADRIVAFYLKIPPLIFSEYQLQTTNFAWYWWIPALELAKIPYPVRRVFVFRDEEKLDYPEISQPIYRPDGTVAFRFYLEPAKENE